MNNSKGYKRSQLPAQVLVVGIDPHKRQHTVSVCREGAQVLSQFKIANERGGFEALLERCERWREQQGANSLIFAIEPGGHYWRTLAAYLSQRSYAWRLINPYTLKRQRDGEDLTRRKNDERDATMAAELLQQGQYTWTDLPEGPYAELRRAHEAYEQLIRAQSRLKLQLGAVLDQLFPEFQSVFKALDGQTALSVLRCNPNPLQMSALDAEAYVAQIATAHAAYGARWCQRAKLGRLHALAAHSIGLQADASALAHQAQGLAEQLVCMQGLVARAHQYLLRCFAACQESRYLLSLEGLGRVNAAGLLAHIGDSRRFSGVKQLSKLAGINPIENSSADYRAARTPMSKKGRAGLRLVAWRSVIELLRRNAFFQAYVKGLVERAVHPLKKREAIGAAMNKLLRIVYSLLHKGEMFDLHKALAA
jgi:transposase